MADYIDREQAIEALCIGCLDGCSKHCAEYTRLKSVPSADVRVNVHGEWKKTNPHLGHEYIWYCSNCGQDCMETIMGKPKWNFCPNCGSRMVQDGKAD